MVSKPWKRACRQLVTLQPWGKNLLRTIADASQADRWVNLETVRDGSHGGM